MKKINIKEINNLDECYFHFTNKKNLESINDLVNSDTTNIASNDPDGNIRYIGAKSKNYGNLILLMMLDLIFF